MKINGLSMDTFDGKIHKGQTFIHTYNKEKE
jgi:hypothetical protein